MMRDEQLLETAAALLAGEYKNKSKNHIENDLYERARKIAGLSHGSALEFAGTMYNKMMHQMIY